MTTEEKIAVMQAYVDGKQIQIFINGEWIDWIDWMRDRAPNWDWERCDYRIKSEEKKIIYKPYKDTDEMIADFKERFDVNVPHYSMPLIWLSNKNVPEYSLVTDYDFKDGVCTSDMGWGFTEIFERYTYLDGSPVGKLVEEC